MYGFNRSPARVPRILVVEDEILVSTLIEDVLTDLGCHAVGPASCVAWALALADTEKLDGALLDLNIGGEPAYPIADALTARGIPYMFITGYSRDSLLRPYAGVPTLEKPFNVGALSALVRESMMGNGQDESWQWPRGRERRAVGV